MSADDDIGFASPPFRPDETLQRLQRDLRAAGLVERAGTFERRGVAIAKVALVDGVLTCATVKRPSRSSPEWQTRALKSAADVRDYVADLKKKLAAWSDRDD